MRAERDWRCADHDDRFECQDALLASVGDGDVGLIVHGVPGRTLVPIAFCPWCGSRVA